MIDKKIVGESLTVENFKDYILEMEKDNLKNLTREDKKQMVAKIVRTYEEAKKNDNKQRKNNKF